MAFQPGDLIANKYRIECQLGEGGMGVVYVAVNERLQKRVALKVLHDAVADMGGALDRFTREPIAASRTKHPGIVEIYDADLHEGVPWIAMELLEGETFAARLARGSFSGPHIVQVVCEALEAVATVHDAGIVHRDLKPENIFLERLPRGGERVKVLDFGIAKISGEEMSRMTATGIAMGTPEFLAPEQAMGQRDVDHRADIYAVGAILYNAFSGSRPYEVDSFGQLVAKMIQEGPRSLRVPCPNLPPPIIQVVDRCLAVDRDHRPRSAWELLSELRHILAGLAQQSGANTSPAAMAGTMVAGGPTPFGQANPPTPMGHQPIASQPIASRPMANPATGPGRSFPSAAPIDSAPFGASASGAQQGGAQQGGAQGSFGSSPLARSGGHAPTPAAGRSLANAGGRPASRSSAWLIVAIVAVILVITFCFCGLLASGSG